MSWFVPLCVNPILERGNTVLLLLLLLLCHAQGTPPPRDFLEFLDFWIFRIFWNFWIFFYFFSLFGFLSKLLMLLLKVIKVNTGHQKLPKMGQNSIISSLFFAQKKASVEGRSPPQELEVGPRSRRYLLAGVQHKSILSVGQLYLDYFL